MEKEKVLDAFVAAIADAVAERLRTQLPASPPSSAPASETEWLDTKAAAKYLSFKPKTLQEWRETGRGPKAHKVGARNWRYWRADLEAYVRRGGR